MKRHIATPTNTEFVINDGEFIVSKTDAKGIIKYANAEFIKISGFTEEELIGQPHNIVRHPDMPKAAFKDLWDTVRTGKQWKGIVKNLCKCGGFYWVDAYVTPSYQNGEIIGFMSVRRRPTQEQIDSATGLYADMLAEEMA